MARRVSRSRRSYTKSTKRRTYSPKRSTRSAPRAQRLVIQVQTAAPPSPGIMRDPAGGSRLVMPGQPVTRTPRKF